MNRHPGLIGAAMAAFALSACDSQAQEEIDQQAKAIDKSYEAEAALTEAVAAGGPNEAAAHNKAEALRDTGEAMKDHLMAEADTLDDVPKK